MREFLRLISLAFQQKVKLSLVYQSKSKKILNIEQNLNYRVRHSLKTTLSDEGLVLDVLF